MTASHFVRPDRCRQWVLTAAVAFGFLRLATHAAPAHAQRSPSDTSLVELSLEQLMNVEVRSVSKKEERLFSTPAAVFVLTSADLRRTGVASIPEALQLVPGLHVAQTRGSQWAVGSRGYSGQYASRLLVLVDGRSVYSRLFGGVMWEEEDLPISEIDRIEVIRGPGAAMWGANAVNGVINIVTKEAAASDGGAISARAGRLGHEALNAHVSGALTSNWQFRTFVDHKGGDSLKTATGATANDNWSLSRGGIRTMWKKGTQSLTVSTDVHRLDYGVVWPYASSDPNTPLQVRVRSRFDGGHVLTRWEHTDAEDGRLTVQAYMSGNHRLFSDSLRDREQTIDLEIQRVQHAGSRQRLVYGGGFRTVLQQLQGSTGISFSRSRIEERFWNAFAQDEISIVPTHVSTTIGAKLEHNPYSGWEFQPKLSVSFLPSDRQTLWVSVSRAVRIPATEELYVTYPRVVLPAPAPGFPTTTVAIVGNPALGAERLEAWEAGYRIRPASTLSFDLALFRNKYPNQRIYEEQEVQILPVPPAGMLFIGSMTKLTGKSDVRGAELLARWEPTLGWVLEGAYSALHWKFTPPANAVVQQFERDGSAPANQARVRSSMSLPGNVDVDVTYRYTSELPALKVSSRHEVDARVAWLISKHLELAVGGRNLLSPAQVQFYPETGSEASRIPWKSFVSATLRF